MRYCAIIGTGRSGTTLLSNLIDGLNEDVYVHPVEINLCSAFYDLENFGKIKYETKYYANFKKLKLGKVKKTKLIQYYKGQFHQLQNFIDQVNIDYDLKNLNLGKIFKKNLYSLQEFIDEFFSIIIKTLYPGKNINLVIFKTLDVSHCDELKENIRNLKIIHSIRNPIKTYESLVRAPRIDPNVCLPPWYLAGDNISTILNRCSAHMNYVLKNSNNENDFIVKYEDIIRNGLKSLTELQNFLKLEKMTISNAITILGGYEPKSLPHNVGLPVSENKLHLSIKQFKHQEDTFLYDNERKLFIFSLFNMAKKFGYFENMCKPSKISLMTSWLIIAKWELSHISNYYTYNNSNQKISYVLKVVYPIIGFGRALKGLLIRRRKVISELLS